MRTRLAIFGVALSMTGCGSSPSVCTPGPPTLAVSPHMATADHAAFAPYNQQQFLATSSPGIAASGCATPETITLLKPSWTVSDPLDVTISSAPDSTNGLAICAGPTDGSATVTARIVTSSGTTLVTALLHCE